MQILIVKTSSLGDIIHAYPVLQYLKNLFPDCQIDFVVENNFKELVVANPLVDQAIIIDTKRWRKRFFQRQTWANVFRFIKNLREKKYDLVVDLQGNTKSSIATFFAKSEKKLGFGFKSVHEWPNLLVTNLKVNPPLNINVREENLYLLKHHFDNWMNIDNHVVTLKLESKDVELYQKLEMNLNSELKNKVLVCCGSAWKNKQMSLAGLVNLLSQIERKIETQFYFIWGNDQEKEFVREVAKNLQHSQVMDKLSLPLLQNVMRLMDLIISMDSLPLHLAGTTGVKTIGIFGASSAEKYMPTGINYSFYQGTCPYGVTFERRCPKLRTCPTGSCIQGLSGDEIYKKIEI